MEFITAYCRIKNKSLVLNGRIVFDDKSISLDDWMQKAFEFFQIEYPRFYKMDRLSKLGVLAAELLLKGSAVSTLNKEAVAVVLANSNSSTDTDKRYFEASKRVPSPGLFVYTLPNIVIGEIAIRHQFKGENSFFIAEKFDGELMVDYVHQVLLQPFTNAAVAGWIDVLDEHHDVLVYLVEKESRPGSVPHTLDHLGRLYQD